MAGTVTIETRDVRNGLTAAVQHHARNLQPLIDALSGAILLAPLGDEHVRQSRTGPNSFSWVLRDGTEYHFRGRRYSQHGGKLPLIEVKDRYQNGTVVAKLTTVEECRRFVAKARGSK